MGRLGRIPEGTIWCMICGRPLRPGEDFARWRIRVLQRSSLYLFDLRAICPSHYGDDPDGHGRPAHSGDDPDGHGPPLAAEPEAEE